ncbi:MAG: cyclic nucleotide-binding domain-containing protein [Treponema sp.]|nr:cyclic nucleotide-binding domain-containing protein [Treponema sp.]
MKKILISSSNKDVLNAVKNACMTYSDYFDPLYSPDTDETMSLMDYEIPEVKVLDFSSKDIDNFRILSAINMDPWFHNGGVIAIAEDPRQAQELEDMKNQNILIVQTLHSFISSFSRLLKVLWSNQHILFNRGMQESMGGLERGKFVCDNDPLNARLYTSFLVNYLYCSNRIDVHGRYALQTTLQELLANAIEHGNCGISYIEKTQWIENGGDMLDLVNERRNLAENKDKKVHISYTITKKMSTFTIKDEGQGFDWKKQIDDFQPNVLEAHGRGIVLSMGLVSNLRYNDAGNEVSFDIDNLQNVSNNIPGIMIPFKATEFKKGECVCKRGDHSSDLFFIVAGTYGVYFDEKMVSVLTPKDMFIGEMAFLLDDKRTATVIAEEPGKLICIPKVAFVNLIRKNPHYGIFFSKLLAQRVIDQRENSIKLQNRIDELEKKLSEK